MFLLTYTPAVVVNKMVTKIGSQVVKGESLVKVEKINKGTQESTLPVTPKSFKSHTTEEYPT